MRTLFIPGEVLLGIPALIKYPWFEEETGYQLFPFKTLTAVINFITVIVVSIATNYMFKDGRVSKKYDFLNAFGEEQPDEKSNAKPTSNSRENGQPEMNKDSAELQPMMG